MLYTLHITPVIDSIGIKEIAEHTTKDPVLYELRELIKSGKNYIPKNKPFRNPYREILSEITYVANGTLLKQDKIILPETLYEKAIKLAHSGAHPGQNGLIRRLRSHFFIKNLEKKVSEFVNNCFHCQMFTNKVYRHPIEPNKVPGKCWEETSVDLFGPLPSQNHIKILLLVTQWLSWQNQQVLSQLFPYLKKHMTHLEILLDKKVIMDSLSILRK